MDAKEQSIEILTRLLEAAAHHIDKNRDLLQEAFESIIDVRNVNIEEFIDRLTDDLTEYMVETYPERAWQDAPRDEIER